MKRKFKNVTISQMMELRDKLSDKLAHGCSIEDALFYVQCYAAVDELLEIKEKGPLYDWTDIEGYKHPKSDRTIFLDKYLTVHVGYYCGRSNSWYCSDSVIHVPDKDVIAWMEYPNYKGRS